MIRSLVTILFIWTLAASTSGAEVDVAALLRSDNPRDRIAAATYLTANSVESVDVTLLTAAIDREAEPGVEAQLYTALHSQIYYQGRIEEGSPAYNSFLQWICSQQDRLASHVAEAGAESDLTTAALSLQAASGVAPSDQLWDVLDRLLGDFSQPVSVRKLALAIMSRRLVTSPRFIRRVVSLSERPAQAPALIYDLVEAIGQWQAEGPEALGRLQAALEGDDHLLRNSAARALINYEENPRIEEIFLPVLIPKIEGAVTSKRLSKSERMVATNMLRAVGAIVVQERSAWVERLSLWATTAEQRDLAIIGLYVMGERASEAEPVLTELTNDPNKIIAGLALRAERSVRGKPE